MLQNAKCLLDVLFLFLEEDVEFNEYPVHVLTSVMKCFFREMPSPLMTDDLYVGFIRAAGKDLSQPNSNLLEMGPCSLMIQKIFIGMWM